MLNLFSFFKQQANEFRQDNKHRSPEYIAGGIDALREAGDSLTAQKDVVDLEWVTNQLHAQEKEARELRTTNKAFDELRRTFQSRCDLQTKEIERLRSQIANKDITTVASEIQSRADKRTGQWQSITASLRVTFYEVSSILAGKEQHPANKVAAASKLLGRALADSTNRKHKILGNWLLTNELPQLAAAPVKEEGVVQL